MVVDSRPTEVADTGPEARGDRSRSAVLLVVTHQLEWDGLHVVRHASPPARSAPAPHLGNNSLPTRARAS